jgi:hypothetical protein
MSGLHVERCLALLVDLLQEQGEIVYSHYWESGAPWAGAECETVYRWHECYFARDSHEGFSGPFATLDEALQEGGLVQITSATVSIACDELSTTALIARLTILDAEVGQMVTINGNRRRVTRNGRLGRIK